MTTYFVVALIGFVFSVIATLIVRPVAIWFGLVDHPDGYRKLHKRSTPLGGGLAIFVATTLAMTVAYVIPNPLRDIVREHSGFLGMLFASAFVLMIVGIVDDRFSIRARHKLFGQIVAVAILLFSGMQIGTIGVFGLAIHLGLLAIPFTVFWLLGAINSLNLLDGVDGLATTIGLILATTTGALSVYQGHAESAVISFAMVGALLGFLCFNFPPAKIFLGDAGSMLIGLVIGVVAIRGSLKGTATVALAAPLAIWAIPIFDTSAAILRRKLTARSLNSTDRNHLHHSLMAIFGSNVKTVGIVGLCCTVTCAGALFGVFLGSDFFAIVTVMAVIGILVSSRVFGYIELLHVGRHIRSLSRNWLTLRKQTVETPVFHDKVSLDESEEWDDVWMKLTQAAEKHQLIQLSMNVVLPYSGKQFHANWQRPHWEKTKLWRTEIPLLSDERVVGKIVFLGERDDICTSELLGRLFTDLQSSEMQIRELIASEQADVETDQELIHATTDEEL